MKKNQQKKKNQYVKPDDIDDTDDLQNKLKADKKKDVEILSTSDDIQDKIIDAATKRRTTAQQQLAESVQLQEKTNDAIDKNINGDNKMDPDTNTIKALNEVNAVKKQTEQAIKQEIIRKTTFDYSADTTIESSIKEIASPWVKEATKLFRLFMPKSMRLYDAAGRETLAHRWYWELINDNIPTGDYSVREHFFNLYSDILKQMSDYVLLSKLAVDNPRSRTSGKIVDSESKKIVEEIFVDEQTTDAIRGFIADMRQRDDPFNNVIRYPTILHQIDHDINLQLIQGRRLMPLTDRNIIDLLPRSTLNDINYIFVVETSFRNIDMYLPYLRIQDRLELHRIPTLWDGFVNAQYVLTRSYIQDLTLLASAEEVIANMSKELNIAALSIQSEQDYTNGISSASANDIFKSIVASVVSQRTLVMEFSASNLIDILSCAYALTLIPGQSFHQENLYRMQLTIINNLVFPALGLPLLAFRNAQQTPFQIAAGMIADPHILAWIQTINNMVYQQVQENGVITYTFMNNVLSGDLSDVFMAFLAALSTQRFPNLPTTTQQTMKKALALYSRRAVQARHAMRLVSYTVEVFRRLLTMSTRNIQTLSHTRMIASGVTSYVFLTAEKPTIPSATAIIEFRKSMLNFVHNYNEVIDDNVILVRASNALRLYDASKKVIVLQMLKQMKIFNMDSITDDVIYTLRVILSRMNPERRRNAMLEYLTHHMNEIIQYSEKVAQGVIYNEQKVNLVHDDIYGFANVRRDFNGIANIINIEDLLAYGRYDQILDAILQNHQVALQGAVAYSTTQSVADAVSNVAEATLGTIIRDKNVTKMNPVMLKISSNSPDYYMLARYNYHPSASVQIVKRQNQLFHIDRSYYDLQSPITLNIVADVITFIKRSMSEQAFWVSVDRNPLFDAMHGV